MILVKADKAQMCLARAGCRLPDRFATKLYRIEQHWSIAMLIRDILDQKRDRVETIWPERTLGEAIARFDERNISSVIVVDHADHPIGIVTDRDALRAIARRGPAALHLSPAEVMRSPPPSCCSRDTVSSIMHRMTFDRIRHVVVIDDGRLSGIVSIGDLLKSRLQDADLESRVLRDRALGRLAAE